MRRLYRSCHLFRYQTMYSGKRVFVLASKGRRVALFSIPARPLAPLGHGKKRLEASNFNVLLKIESACVKVDACTL